MTLAGALGVKGVEKVRPYESGAQLDLPGHPTAIATPGHSIAHHSLLFSERGVLIAGDAFVMVDPYTGRTGPRLVAGAATADAVQALASTQILGELDADIALTGHGSPWNGTLKEVADRVEEACGGG
jgi:glyoxylase-like metal-dependent hydrolase (beta-lactamase superfamily II)